VSAVHTLLDDYSLLADIYQRFGGTWGLYLQGRRILFVCTEDGGNVFLGNVGGYKPDLAMVGGLLIG
jgi:hypothetical protein